MIPTALTIVLSDASHPVGMHFHLFPKWGIHDCKNQSRRYWHGRWHGARQRLKGEPRYEEECGQPVVIKPAIINRAGGHEMAVTHFVDCVKNHKPVESPGL